MESYSFGRASERCEMWTNLCMSDRWRREKPLQQLQRLPGRTGSGTPAWSVCPSGTAGRRRPEAAQTHLQRHGTHQIWNILLVPEVNIVEHCWQKEWEEKNTFLKCYREKTIYGFLFVLNYMSSVQWITYWHTVMLLIYEPIKGITSTVFKYWACLNAFRRLCRSNLTPPLYSHCPPDTLAQPSCCGHWHYENSLRWMVQD